MSTRLVSIVAGDPPDPWAALGFAIGGGGRLALANGAIDLTGTGSGLLGLAVEAGAGLPDPGLREPGDIEGVPLAPGTVVPGADHDNGATELDHVVFRTPDLEATSGAITAALGLELRRIRETDTARQGFHRFPDQGGVRGCIIEVVEDPRATATSLWGLVINVEDLDAAVARLGDSRISPPKPAVQAGRGIATIRRGAGLSVPLALMTPA